MLDTVLDLMVSLFFCVFFSRRYGAKADIAPVRYLIEACECAIVESWTTTRQILVDQNCTKVEKFKLYICKNEAQNLPEYYQ